MRAVFLCKKRKKRGRMLEVICDAVTITIAMIVHDKRIEEFEN